MDGNELEASDEENPLRSTAAVDEESDSQSNSTPILDPPSTEGDSDNVGTAVQDDEDDSDIVSDGSDSDSDEDDNDSSSSSRSRD